MKQSRPGISCFPTVLCLDRPQADRRQARNVQGQDAFTLKVKGFPSNQPAHSDQPLNGASAERVGTLAYVMSCYPQVECAPVCQSYTLHPAVGAVYLCVPAVLCVVCHLVVQMLPESKPLGVNAHIHLQHEVNISCALEDCEAQKLCADVLAVITPCCLQTSPT